VIRGKKKQKNSLKLCEGQKKNLKFKRVYGEGKTGEKAYAKKEPTWKPPDSKPWGEGRTNKKKKVLYRPDLRDKKVFAFKKPNPTKKN